MSAEWRAAPEYAQLRRALELLSSQPSDALIELERLAGSRSEIARQMAALNLAKAYSKGEFGDPDYVKAEEWYRRAANNGLQEAEYELGKFLRRIDQYDRALDILKRSAAIGYAPSMRTVGTMHAKGEGVPRDLHQARRWWERSIAGGNVFAKRELAFAMIRGEYGWIDRPLGALLFLSALADAAYIGWTSAGRRDVRFT